MERQLFEWENWDQLDTMCFCFYDCTLKVKIGEHEPETKVDCIILSYGDGESENGYIQLQFGYVPVTENSGNPERTEDYGLTLQVGSMIGSNKN